MISLCDSVCVLQWSNVVPETPFVAGTTTEAGFEYLTAVYMSVLPSDRLLCLSVDRFSQPDSLTTV